MADFSFAVEPTWHVMLGDVRTALSAVKDSSVHCVVTSPPYFGLRDYGTASWDGGDPTCDHFHQQGGRNPETSSKQLTSKGTTQTQYKNTCAKCGAARIDAQIGLEDTPDEYVAELVVLFREVWRVLRDDGTVWLNLGDSYVSSPRGNKPGDLSTSSLTNPERQDAISRSQKSDKLPGLKSKDLIGIPWRVALALQADGWYLRSDIIWSKRNPMVESVRDRCTKSHEYIFMLTKSPRYFFDADAIAETSIHALGEKSLSRGQARVAPSGNGNADSVTVTPTRNARTVWDITTTSYKEAHFATFPIELPTRCIKAGTSEAGCCSTCGAPVERVVTKGALLPHAAARIEQNARGNYTNQKDYESAGVQTPGDVMNRVLDGMRERISSWSPGCDCNAPAMPCMVLDIFSGSGTTGFVAISLGRSYIGIELNPEYREMSRRRIATANPLFSREV